ncbi:MAG: hypothetical protein EKK48_30005 [Candidatus Melainabacteria bacterium]|nr:MAG: hypothetical protein EKK48_30005 [Candidatus Melainabacteria bacterium]
MKIAKLFIKGEFEQAYMYMGRLIIFEQNKQIRFINLSQISKNLRSRFKNRIPFYEWLFIRSDWLANKQTRSLLWNEGYNALMKTAIGDCSDTPIEFELESLTPELIVSLRNNTFNAMLDCAVYNGEIYVGTDKGLFHARGSWKGKTIEFSSSKKRHDLKIIHTSAQYATVNLSCGSDGLHTAYEDFDSATRKAFRQHPNVSKSYATTWCKFDLVNYESFEQPNMFRGVKGTPKKLSIERETTVMAEIQDNPYVGSIWDLQRKLEKNITVPKVDTARLRYSFNAGQLFYGVMDNGEITRTRVSYTKGSDPKPIIGRPEIMRVSKVAKESNDFNDFQDIVSSQPLPTLEALTIQTFDAVDVLTPQGIVNLLREPAISIRTFPQSHQYRNIILVTTDNGLWIMSAFDDRIFEQHTLDTPLLNELEPPPEPYESEEDEPDDEEE